MNIKTQISPPPWNVYPTRKNIIHINKFLIRASKKNCSHSPQTNKKLDTALRIVYIVVNNRYRRHVNVPKAKHTFQMLSL